MPLSFTRTLRLKVRREAYAWLNAAAVEVNEVFNYCNETSLKAATRTNERNTSVTCSTCMALSGPRGVNGLIVR
jgi:hypothetical protein